MTKILLFVFTYFLLFTGSTQATSAFLCEDLGAKLTLVVTTKNVMIITGFEEKEYPVQIQTIMHNNNLKLEISDLAEILNITLDIRERDLIHIASFNNEEKNIAQRPISLKPAILRGSFLKTIYGVVNYHNTTYHVSCKLDDQTIDI